MNIWIFNHYALPPNRPGGTRHYDLGKELVQRGHNVVIFASDYNYLLCENDNLKDRNKWKVEDVEKVKFVWVKTFPYKKNNWRRFFNMMSYMIRCARIGKRITRIKYEIERPNIIIGSSVHLFAPLVAFYLSRHYHVPFIIEIRDLWPQTLIDMGVISSNNFFVRFVKTFEKFLYKKAKIILVLLPQAYKYIKSYGINIDKIKWIPNGVNLSNYSNYFSKLSKDNKIFKIMYTGAHGKANALDVIIQAAKILQDRKINTIRIILIGNGPEKPYLIRLKNRLKLNNVEFYAPVPKEKMAKVLSEADAFIFNLESIAVFKYGISSNKLFDYMAAARPIIFSVKTCNNPVKEANCGLTVPPRDPEALADAIIKIYNMPEEDRKKMGLRGRQYVEKYHNWKILATEFEKICIELLNQ